MSDKKSSAGPINIIALVSAAAVAAATLLPYYASGLGRIGARFDHTQLGMGTGVIVIVFAALSILFALLRKRVPLLIFSILTGIICAVMFFAILSEKPYAMSLEMGAGAYISLIGGVALALSVPIWSAVKRVQ